MDREHYREMAENLQRIGAEDGLRDKRIYLFGHCNATEALADLLLEMGYRIRAILDNSQVKWGGQYRKILIQAPSTIAEEPPSQTVVLIVARFYEAMAAQLKRLGYRGDVWKLVDYDTYAEYSLSDDTIERKRDRVAKGADTVRRLEEGYPGAFRIFCPFKALGDVYLCMSYLPYLLRQRGALDHVVCVIGDGCAEVAALLGTEHVEVLGQAEMDAAVQAELYMQDGHAFIAHQDRPYVVDLPRALYIKKIPLEIIYRCGVFGLPKETRPIAPTKWRTYNELDRIQEGRGVILAPYAKSVPTLPNAVWEEIVWSYQSRGYQVLTNVAGDEGPIEGTEPIRPGIREMRSVVERAGTFIGVRSGICDVIRTADCRKIALYPDYHYCDTRWRAVEIYAIDGFEDIVVEEGFVWQDR